tara:strand:+ start:3831 stop:5276 length:1446 start_codon:yes stop_codon:yes gene_type:complete
MILRPYQNDAIQELSKGWKENKRQVLALTTGGGKTVIFSEIAKLATDRSKTVLILTHRTELFEQANTTFSRIGIVPELINAKQKEIPTDRSLYIAMVETIARRVQLMEQIKPDLIIIDECHIGNFTKILDAYPGTFTLGVTATPVGKHFFNYYSRIVQTIDTPDLIEQEFLVPCRAFQMIKEVTGLEKKQGEYTDSSLMEFFDKALLYEGVIENYKNYALGLKTLVFNCNIKHSETMSEAFNDAGIQSMSLTSKNTAEERKQILEWFENTPDAVLNNAGILTAGYDHPPIECIIVNRATMSLPLWLQMCGRGSRIYPGKSDFTVLDFGGNHSKHGLWSQPRQWTIDTPKEKKEQAAPVKECPSCAAMLPMSIRVCNFCDYVYPLPKKELEAGVMVEFKSDNVIGKKINDLTIDEMVLMAKSKRKYNVASITIWRMLRSRGKEAIKEYAQKMNYKHGWTIRQIKEIHLNQFLNYTIQWKTKN